MGQCRAIAGFSLTVLAIGMLGAVPVDVCVEPSFEAAVAVVRLGEHSPAVDLRPVRPARCNTGDGYRLRFVHRGAAVVLVLATPAGERLEREVPWVARAEDGIVALARQGRLGSLAILLDGLVLEDRALRALSPASPPIAADPPLAPPPVARPEATPALTMPEADPAGPTAAPPAPPLAAPAPTRRRARPGPIAARRGGGPPPTPRATRIERASPEGPARPPPPPEPAPFPDGLLADAGPERRRRPSRSEAPGGSATAAASAPADDPTPAEPGLRARVGLGVGGAMRAPSVLGFEATLRVNFAGLLVEVGGQPVTAWELEGRPLEVTAAWAGLGWSPSLWSGAVLEVEGRLLAVVERLTVLRLEIPDAVTRALWDAGIEAGALVSGPMGDGWRMGGVLGVRWMGTASGVLIPEGPRAPLNTWQVRVGLAVDWGP